VRTEVKKVSLLAQQRNMLHDTQYGGWQPQAQLGDGSEPRNLLKCHCEACLLGRSNLIIFAFCILIFNIIIAPPLWDGKN